MIQVGLNDGIIIFWISYHVITMYTIIRIYCCNDLSMNWNMYNYILWIVIKIWLEYDDNYNFKFHYLKPFPIPL